MAKKKYKVARPYTDFGHFLAGSRESNGLTQRQVSLKLGYSSAQFISNFERGIATPPIKKAKVLCELYRIPAPTMAAELSRAESGRIHSAMGVRQ
jgi:transcriptional regulator with XRE-family HTH domain